MKQHVKLYEEYTEGSKFFKTREEINSWLTKMTKINDFHINDDLTVDVDGIVYIADHSLDFIPVQFRTVTGSFSCSTNKLTSLEGCSYDVGGDFTCSTNRLKTLKGGPVKVSGGNYVCSENFLTSLEGCPVVFTGHFWCKNNNLTSLVFAPKIPHSYMFNPCTDIYKRLGFTTEAHIEALKTLDPNPVETLRRLKPVYPDRFEDIVKEIKEWRIELGMESEELTSAYNNSKTRGDDFY